MPATLAAELEEVLSTDLDTLPLDEAAAVMGRLEALRTKIEAAALGMLSRFDTSGGWRLDAGYSVANWLAGQTGTTKADARRRARLAEHLQSMPGTAAALATGEITIEHARVLSWCVANPRTRDAFSRFEDHLLEDARQRSADELKNIVRHWIELVDQDGPEPRPPEPDRLFANQVGDRVKIDGDLGLDTGLPILEALRERADQLYRRDREVANANPDDPLATRTAASRRAEALYELVMAGAGDQSNPAHREPLFNVYGDARTLFDNVLHPDSIRELANGTVLPIDLLALWKCDAAVARTLLDAKGAMLSYGRTERYANRELRRALAARDRGCAIPGCDRPPEHCDAHHIVFWDDDGTTDIDNLALVCRHHHRMIHAGSLTITMVDGVPHFFDANGQPLATGRRRPPPVPAV